MPVNSLSSRIDPTQLHMVSRDTVANAAHALLHGGSHEKGEVVVAAAAVLFAVMAERAAMDPQDLYRLGHRILTAPSDFHIKPNVQMEALRDYAGLHIRDQPVI